MSKPTARKLLNWYDAHARVLPWRALPHETADPYAVWLSEIMLQQTTVATVGPYFEKFMNTWPTVHALAAADQDAVMHAWAGLGYYSRARNLHACAKVVSEAGGDFPQTEEGLAALPGIGPYTAAAVAAIAFDRPATVVDGNVERVVSRLFRIETPLPTGKKDVREKAETLTPAKRPGDFAQAMMDLGATICTPKKPKCGACPWEKGCAARTAGDQETYPRRAPKKKKPTRRGAAFWLTNEKGAVLIRKRPPKGLLGGMMEFPGTEWLETERTPSELLNEAPVQGGWQKLARQVRHTFTHFHLELDVFTATCDRSNVEGTWVQPDDLGDHALPTLMVKVATLAQKDDGPLFQAARS